MKKWEIDIEEFEDPNTDHTITYYTVTNGNRNFTTEEEYGAKWLCAFLNSYRNEMIKKQSLRSNK